MSNRDRERDRSPGPTPREHLLGERLSPVPSDPPGASPRSSSPEYHPSSPVYTPPSTPSKEDLHARIGKLEYHVDRLYEELRDVADWMKGFHEFKPVATPIDLKENKE